MRKDIISSDSTKNLFKLIKDIKSLTLYMYNYSGDNPIVGKITSISEDKEMFGMYVTSGTTYDGYRGVTLKELKEDWYVDREEFLAAGPDKRKNWYEKHVKFAALGIDYDEIEKVTAASVIEKLTKREAVINRI